VDNWKNITNSQNRVRKKSFGGTFCFSNCHICIIGLDTGGLVFLVSGDEQQGRKVGKYFPLALGKKKYSSGNCSFVTQKVLSNVVLQFSTFTGIKFNQKHSFLELFYFKMETSCQALPSSNVI
jgi:hypothetical protein